LTVGSEQQPSAADALEHGSFRIERSHTGTRTRLGSRHWPLVNIRPG
jgi:hypothetical protein